MTIEKTIAAMITMNRTGYSEIKLSDIGLTGWILGWVMSGETVGTIPLFCVGAGVGVLAVYGEILGSGEIV